MEVIWVINNEHKIIFMEIEEKFYPCVLYCSAHGYTTTKRQVMFLPCVLC